MYICGINMYLNIVKPENVSFMNSCHLFTGLKYMHYSIMGEMGLPFIDSDLLYRGALYRQWFVI
jgi:hypothetical protein